MVVMRQQSSNLPGTLLGAGSGLIGSPWADSNELRPAPHLFGPLHCCAFARVQSERRNQL